MVSRRELPDAAERSRVTNELDATLFVEAGAGTGKTASLVTRIVNLVSSGVPVERIAAITFTEAAASELRVRVRDALSARGEAAQDQSLLDAAADVESAAFTTLHGFALRLLSEFPIEAGLPPGFSVADEVSSVLSFDTAWRDFVAKASDDMTNIGLFERADALKVGLKKFLEIARKFDDNWDVLDRVEPPEPLSAIDFSELFSNLQKLADRGDECLFEADKLAQRLRDFSDDIAAAQAVDGVDQLTVLKNFSFPPKNVGKATNWPKTPVAEVRKEIDHAKALVSSSLEQYQQQVLSQMISLVVEFVEARVSARLVKGELGFHDLLVLARKLVRTNQEVRRRFHQRYSKILLDEFQDTDPIQIELAVLLATDESDIDRPWPELAERLPAGRLLVVGDPKQSIYRFRRADMGVYSQAEDSLGERPTMLTTNFRSVPGIVAWVNHMFGSLMGDGIPGQQPRYSPLQAYRSPDHDTEGVVKTIGGPREENLATIREAEAADVASVINSAIDERWRTEREGTWQPVRLSDIAVLIPSRLSLPALETAFERAGIAYRPETSSLVYATQEIRDVLAGVRAVSDPTNEVMVLAALRSSLFSIDDSELASWHRRFQTWDYRNVDQFVALAHTEGTEDPSEHPVGQAFEVLRGWHAQRWWIDPAELVSLIVKDRRLRELALAAARPRDRWRRYRFLAEQARGFTAAQDGDLHAFIEWVDVQASETARVVEPIPPEPDDDAVRVLTIHGSKGLEFPMVVVAGAATQERSGGFQVRALFPPGAAPQVKVGAGAATKEYSIFSSVEEALDGFERIRLDYVAATRARDILVVSAYHKTSGRVSNGRRTWTCMETAPTLWEAYQTTGARRKPISSTAQLHLGSGTFASTIDRWKSSQKAILENNARVRHWSASRIARATHTTSQLTLAERRLGGESTDLPIQTGPDIGSAVHDILRRVEFGNPNSLDLLVREVCRHYGIPDAADEVEGLVTVALASSAVNEAADHDHWRELYVSMPTLDGLLEGYIDLCYATDDDLVIVDYKTDRLIGSPTEVAERYLHQLAAYSLALGHVAQRPVTKTVFLFLRASPGERVVVADVGQARQEVAALVGVRATDLPTI